MKKLKGFSNISREFILIWLYVNQIVESELSLQPFRKVFYMPEHVEYVFSEHVPEHVLRLDKKYF